MTREKQQEPLHVHNHLGDVPAWPAWLRLGPLGRILGSVEEG